MSTLFEQVIGELSNGKTIERVARAHAMPTDLVKAMVEQAEREGKLDYYTFDNGRCSFGLCNPDPDSLICAGCPLFPKRAKAKKQ
jgi:hypothetical protein